MNSPGDVATFICRIAPNDLRRVLLADPLGVDALAKSPEPALGELREVAMEILCARPRLFAAVVADQSEIDAQARAQMQLFEEALA